MREHRAHPKVYFVSEPEGEKGWWFRYTTLDGDTTEDGPFETRKMCEDVLMNELEDLLCEASDQGIEVE